jgi:hypothetical protein
MIDAFLANDTLTNMLAKDGNNIPAIFPYHHRDTDARTPYPQVTLTRFGSSGDMRGFSGSQHGGLTTKMDDPRMAICVWSTVGIDECWKIYRLIDDMLRGDSAQVSNSYFGSYRINRTVVRDDLFDATVNAFHLHSEYSAWIMLTNTPQP